MLILEATGRVVRPEAKVHGVHHKGVGQHLLQSVLVGVHVILRPRLECNTTLCYFLIKFVDKLADLIPVNDNILLNACLHLLIDPETCPSDLCAGIETL